MLDEVRTAMADVVSAPDGTGHAAKIDGIVVAGKTGTAQVVKEAQGARTKETALPDKYRDHGWFMAFAPADHPRIAVACIIEHSGHGGSTAAPVVKQVMEKYFELYPAQGGPAVPAPDTGSETVDPLAD
jgi:penicillin-binding protein 2